MSWKLLLAQSQILDEEKDIQMPDFCEEVNCQERPLENVKMPFLS